MTQQSHPALDLDALFQTWQQEHQQVQDHLDGILDWLSLDGKMVDELGARREVVAELERLCGRLRRHFSTESQLGTLLETVRGRQTQEIALLRARAESDQRHLMSRLKEQVNAIHEAETGTEAWDSAVYNFGLFVDALEQYEDQEAESVQWLMPRSHESFES